MDISNKNLALVLLIAVIISLGGTILSLNKLSQMALLPASGVTGRAQSGIGQVNLTISSNASCTVDTNVNFGSARPTANTSVSTDNANSVGWDGTLCDGTSNASCTGMIINNTGNVLLNVTYNTSKVASEMLSSDTPLTWFRYMTDNAETEVGCTGTLGPVAWTTIANSSDWTTNNSKICNSLNFITATSAVVMEFNMSILQNITSGVKTADITIYCTQNQ